MISGYVFFVIFQCLVSQVYLNLVVAIIVDAFTSASSAEKLPVDENMLDRLVQIWQKYDPQATYYIPTASLINLLDDFIKCKESETMFVTRDDSVLTEIYRMRLIMALEIPTYDRSAQVMFYDVLQKLTLRAFKI